MRVLVVSTQFPYPPRSGFEMRVYHLVRQLARRHKVTLLSYATPSERVDAEALAREVEVEVEVELVQRAPGSRCGKRAAQAASLVSSLPFACRAVQSEELRTAVAELCARERFDVIQIESSLLCAIALPPDIKVVLDEHNVEYEVFWRMRQSERSALRRAWGRIEHARFRAFEQRAWTAVDGCLVTSERDAETINRQAPGLDLAVVPNSVDLDYFQPAAEEPDPYTVVFNGILDYRPNLDAALHLVDDVWPLVTRRHAEARLTIVGRASDAEIKAVGRPGVTVTGEVADIRPYLERAAVVAVPIRIGGGTRLKVVEGLAMAKPMVSTAVGCEGIQVGAGEHLLIADGAADFASAICRLFEDPTLASTLGQAGRRLIEREYSWDVAGDRAQALYEMLPDVASGDRIALKAS